MALRWYCSTVNQSVNDWTGDEFLRGKKTLGGFKSIKNSIMSYKEELDVPFFPLLIEFSSDLSHLVFPRRFYQHTLNSSYVEFQCDLQISAQRGMLLICSSFICVRLHLNLQRKNNLIVFFSRWFPIDAAASARVALAHREILITPEFPVVRCLGQLCKNPILRSLLCLNMHKKLKLTSLVTLDSSQTMRLLGIFRW